MRASRKRRGGVSGNPSAERHRRLSRSIHGKYDASRGRCCSGTGRHRRRKRHRRSRRRWIDAGNQRGGGRRCRIDRLRQRVAGTCRKCAAAVVNRRDRMHSRGQRRGRVGRVARRVQRRRRFRRAVHGEGDRAGWRRVARFRRDFGGEGDGGTRRPRVGAGDQCGGCPDKCVGRELGNERVRRAVHRPVVR